MKKLLVILITIVLLGSTALADFDFTDMSFDELLELRQQVDAALWASEDWNEVEVPAGVYIIGEDIPAGKYVLSFKGDSNAAPVDLWPDKAASLENKYRTVVQEYLGQGESLNIQLDKGQYLQLGHSYLTYIFKPYTGAALGFK